VAVGADGGPQQGEAVSEHDPRDDYDDEPWRSRPKMEAMVQWPASIISAIGMIQLALSVVSVAWMTGVLVWHWFDPAYFNNEVIWYEVLAGIAAALLCVALNWVILRGARALGSFPSYPLAVAGVILFFFSLPFFYCGVVTLPVGVWAVVVLLNPDVRARFRAVARGTVVLTLPEARDRGTDRST
jgi:peptidoglycan/LPS O-acetylase OafA/YrhL